MKKVLITFFLIMLSNTIFSQDLIVKKNGTILQTEIIQITSSTIQYRKLHKNQEAGQLQSIRVDDVQNVVMRDGRTIVFPKRQSKKNNASKSTSLDSVVQVIVEPRLIRDTVYISATDVSSPANSGNENNQIEHTKVTKPYIEATRFNQATITTTNGYQYEVLIISSGFNEVQFVLQDEEEQEVHSLLTNEIATIEYKNGYKKVYNAPQKQSQDLSNSQVKDSNIHSEENDSSNTQTHTYYGMGGVYFQYLPLAMVQDDDDLSFNAIALGGKYYGTFSKETPLYYGVGGGIEYIWRTESVEHTWFVTLPLQLELMGRILFSPHSSLGIELLAGLDFKIHLAGGVNYDGHKVLDLFQSGSKMNRCNFGWHVGCNIGNGNFWLGYSYGTDITDISSTADVHWRTHTITLGIRF